MITTEHTHLPITVLLIHSGHKHKPLKTKQEHHHSHSHSNATVTSSSAGHLTDELLTVLKPCSWDSQTPNHRHTIFIDGGDVTNYHTHSITVSFGAANLGSPNWWEHVHDVTLVSCTNGGIAHTHVVNSPTTADKCPSTIYGCFGLTAHTATHSLTTGSINDSHAHTLPAANTGNGSGTAEAHTHTFSLSTVNADGHVHPVGGTMNSDQCARLKAHMHSTASFTSAAYHSHTLSGTSGSGGEAAVVAAIQGDGLTLWS